MTKPLFTWAGGKNKMLKKYKPYMPSNVSEYAEPFFGGGAMFIHVMENYSPKRAVINDINEDIIRIYKCIKSDYTEFLFYLNALEKEYIQLDMPTKENTYRENDKTFHCQRWHYYMNVRHDHAYEYQRWSEAKEAATLYFLMRVGFNGIFQINKNTNNRYGTPPGLLKQKSEIYDRDVVEWWHKALQKTDIRSGDWSGACDIDDGFFFFDPPYRDSFADYGNAFTDENLLSLINFANQKNNVFVCNRDSKDGWFEKNKGNLNIETFPVTYTAGRRKKTENGFEAKKATEILLYRVDRNQLF